MNYFLRFALLYFLFQGYCGFCQNEELKEHGINSLGNQNIAETSFVKDSILNTSSKNNIFETLFNLTEFHTDAYMRDSAPFFIRLIDNDTILNNFTVTGNKRIFYYHITAEQTNYDVSGDQTNKQNELEYNFNDNGKATIELKTTYFLRIEGSFQIERNSTEAIKGDFVISITNPTFGLILGENAITQQYQSIQFEIINEQNEYLSVMHGLDLLVKKIQSQDIHNSIMKKFREFEDTFPFLTELFFSRLNGNQVINDIPLDGKKQFSKIGVGPLLIQGLNNVKRVNIKFSSVRDVRTTPVHEIMVMISELRGKCDWYFSSDENKQRRNTHSFSIRNLTIKAGPYFFPDSSSTYKDPFWPHHSIKNEPTDDDYDIEVTLSKINSYSIGQNSNTSQEFSQATISQILDEKLQPSLANLLNSYFREKYLNKNYQPITRKGYYFSSG